MRNKNMVAPTWVIQCKYPTHLCPETEYLVDIHTVGLTEYGHPELAVVVSIPPETAGEILNTLGSRIANGERFDIPGVYENILQDGYPVRMVRAEYGIGNEMMVLILPDESRRLPEDVGCVTPYCQQKEYIRLIVDDYGNKGHLFKE